MQLRITYIALFFFLLNFTNNCIFGQETLPIYSDYLTDNLYLTHPAAAGIDNFSRIRLTGRKLWVQYKDAPELQTFSFNTHFGGRSALGVIFFNDTNGHFSNTGAYLTYAYHINFDNYLTNQLSFGLSLMLLRNTLDGTDFIIPDPIVNAEVTSETFINADFGISYKNEGFFSFYTIKNVLPFNKTFLSDNDINNLNLRKHIFNTGYSFNYSKEYSIKTIVSIMGQYNEGQNKTSIDTNVKVMMPLSNSELWGGISFRKDFESNSLETAQYLTGFLGINLNSIVIAYSYSQQINNYTYSNGGGHQITLGYNFYMERSNVSQPTWFR